jgi:CHAT domain-containing protein
MALRQSWMTLKGPRLRDASTAHLMIEFYKNLDCKLDKAQTLRQTMLGTMKRYPQPIDWAAFMLT